MNCTACNLYKSRTTIVWGEGKKAPLMIIGETPSQEDDLLGEPFRDRYGIYLRKVLSQAGILDEERYLTLAVKCFGKCQSDNVQKCRYWLWQEMQKIKPAVVVPLGKIPTNLLLKTSVIGMKEVVGKRLERTFGNISVVLSPWYSPFWLAQQGRDVYDKSIQFFKELRTIYQAEDALAGLAS
jgi:uracil-DNA glycosylase family 4